MFENLIKDQINLYLSSFIENLDKNQLGISVISGNLELENLQLKTTLFNDSPLPFLLQAGQVGRIFFKIPFWDMFKSPLIIEISNIFGLVKLKPKSQWVFDKYKDVYYEYVKGQLDTFELYVKRQLELKLTDVKE